MGKKNLDFRIDLLPGYLDSLFCRVVLQAIRIFPCGAHARGKASFPPAHVHHEANGNVSLDKSNKWNDW